MIFKIEWQATVGQHLLKVTSTELVEAKDSTEALNSIRTAIITKLSSLNNYFHVDCIRFINIGYPIEVTIEEQFKFINSLNQEGGLRSDIPTSLPVNVEYKRDDKGNLYLKPTYKSS